MIGTTSLLEIQQLIKSEHGDPHHVLGMHNIKINDKDTLVVRAFIPQADKMWVIDPNDEKFKVEMEKLHMDGYFEAILTNRKKLFKYKFLIEGYDGNQWDTYDPYSFLPTLSSMDLHLYGEGTHYKIFDKLGSHPMEIDGIPGVSFAVWAPNAKRVSVIGSFNAWDGRRGQMRVLDRSGIWELFIPGLQKYDKYKFEIKTLSGEIIEKADPYGNFFELRPSPSALVYDINDYKWEDSLWLSERKENNPLNKPMNIYEVHLGSWRRKTEENNRYLSYIELADELIPYVKEMGYTHIELMPVEEHPFDGSWGYQVTGYYAPTSRYGSPDEFMYFIDKCHQNNIGVFLDWVPAHFPKDAHGLAKFDGTALYEHSDPRQGEHPHWGTLIFNYGRKEVKNFLLANALFWLDKYHIDGLRVDAVASMLYLDYGKDDGQWVPNIYGGNENLDAVEFFKHLNSVLKGREDNSLLIAEESTAWPGVTNDVNYGGLGFDLKWNMGWMNDFLRYVEKESIYKKYHHNDLTFSMVYAYTEKFILVLSHDEVVHGKKSMIEKMPGDLWQKFANLRTAYGFMYSHPGKKLLFMGSEFAQFDEWSEERSLDWFLLEYDHHKQMLDYVKDLNNLYKNEKALWEYDFSGKGFEWISCEDWESSIVSFMRKTSDPDDFLLVVCNFTPVPRYDYKIGTNIEGTYTEIFNSDSAKYGGSGVVNEGDLKTVSPGWNFRNYYINITLPPLGFCVYKIKK